MPWPVKQPPPGNSGGGVFALGENLTTNLTTLLTTIIPEFTYLYLWKMAGKEKQKTAEVLENSGISTVSCFGAPAGIRTPDTLLKRQVLCRLSYWLILQTGMQIRK